MAIMATVVNIYVAASVIIRRHRFDLGRRDVRILRVLGIVSLFFIPPIFVIDQARYLFPRRGGCIGVKTFSSPLSSSHMSGHIFPASTPRRTPSAASPRPFLQGDMRSTRHQDGDHADPRIEDIQEARDQQQGVDESFGARLRRGSPTRAAGHVMEICDCGSAPGKATLVGGERF
jgi:hypothetical protein